MNSSKRRKSLDGRTLVARVRTRLKAELLDPEGELRLQVTLERRGPCPELLAVAENDAGHAAERFVAIFKTDRLAVEEALDRGADPLAKGDLVYLDVDQARLVSAALDRVFGEPAPEDEPQRRASKRATSSARRETPRRR